MKIYNFLVNVIKKIKSRNQGNQVGVSNEKNKSKKCHAVVPTRTNLIVPDRRRRILLKVVSVRRWENWVLGIWRGVGREEG